MSPRLGFGRVAVDLSDRNMVGALVLGGKALYVVGLGAVLDDGPSSGRQLDVTSAVGFFYTVPLGGERLLIPLLRPQFDTYDDRAQTEVSLVGGSTSSSSRTGGSGSKATPTSSPGCPVSPPGARA